MMGQIDSDPGCGTTPAQDQTGNLPFTMLQHVARGGREVTNQGTLRVLVVFVRFADDFDNGTNPDWNNFQILPAWAQTIVDPTVPSSGQQYTTLNLSNFFDRVSGGDGQGQHGMLQIVGDVYYVTTDSNREDYDNEEEVHRHVLEKLDNPSLYNVDFSLYDNWEFIQNGEFFTHQYRPGVGDGKVDYIFMNWRSLQMTGFAGYEGIKGLYLNYGGDFITNDGKRITHYSGSTQFGFITFQRGPFNPYDNRKAKTIYVHAHEFCHYVFGGYHFGQDELGFPRFNDGNVDFFALMTAGAHGNLCAYERYRAGWLNP
jgi:hypothetical protein